MERNYGQFLVDVFDFFKIDSGNMEKFEELVSRDDCPVKVGIDTATGKAIIVTDPAFLKSVANHKCEEFKRHLIEALEETARDRLNKHAQPTH